MEKRNIFSLLLVSAFVFSTPAIFAFNGVDSLLDRKELISNLKSEVVENKASQKSEQLTYLPDAPLDYRAKNILEYYAPNGFVSNFGRKEKVTDINEIKRIISEDVQSGENYSPAVQFDVMSYLIAQNDEQSNKLLQKYIKRKGWSPLVFFSEEENVRHVYLLNQAVLSNNKKALKILINAISSEYHKLGKLEKKSKEEIVQANMIFVYFSLYFLMNKIELYPFQSHYAQNEFDNVTLKDIILSGEREKLRIFDVTLKFKYSQEQIRDMYTDVLYKLIDYRIEKGYPTK